MKVLIAVDASEHAERAFDFYVTNLHKPENDVAIFHAKELPSLPPIAFAGAGGFPAEEWSSVFAEHQKKIKALEEHYSLKATNKNIEAKCITIGGKPGEMIVDTANKEGAGMIVMGSRGLGVIRRTFLGSVSDFALHHSKIPVVIVPNPQ